MFCEHVTDGWVLYTDNYGTFRTNPGKMTLNYPEQYRY